MQQKRYDDLVLVRDHDRVRGREFVDCGHRAEHEDCRADATSWSGAGRAPAKVRAVYACAYVSPWHSTIVAAPSGSRTARGSSPGTSTRRDSAATGARSESSRLKEP